MVLFGTLGVAAHSAAAVINGAIPTNDVPPQISGIARYGETLTATPGEWDGTTTTFVYQWRRCEDVPAVLDPGVNPAIPEPCTDIGGATALTYTLGAADMGFRIRVTETAQSGGNSARSAPTAVVAGIPTTGPAPTISGAARVGATLTASVGQWTGGGGDLTTIWSWARCEIYNCDVIDGATSPTYLVTPEDIGLMLVVRVDVTGPAGTGGLPSEPTAAVIPAPAASGTANVAATGNNITVSGSGFGPDTDVTVVLQSDPVTLGVAHTDAAGNFTATFALPAGVVPGAHVLVFIGYDAAGNPITIEQEITLTGGGTLPVTGFGNLALTLAGAGLVLAGAAAVRAGRRRSR